MSGSSFTSAAADSPLRIGFGGRFDIKGSSSKPPRDARDKKANRERLQQSVEQLAELQKMLYAADHHSVLLIFQAMDAAGKDSTISAVLSGVNPAGCEVYSFKQPSKEELGHDFLWRSARCLPSRGRIGVFNRSYYEEVLVVRVHPEYLGGQHLPHMPKSLDALWQERYESIRDHEKHLARNGTLILKFWLNVSRQEQRERFLARLDEPGKNWKFTAGDVVEGTHWKHYRKAYAEMLAETSRPWAPWYAIPADSKSFMRAEVADIVVRSMKRLKLQYPEPGKDERARYAALRKQLLAQKTRAR